MVVIKPSKYQQNIYMHVLTTNKHLAISAGPGSGKTHTIIEASKLIPYNKKACFQAFGRSIVAELKKKLPENVLCSTMHSMGAKAIHAHFPGEVTTNKKKQIGFIEPYFKEEKSNRVKWTSIYIIDRVMSMARSTMTPPKIEEMTKMVEKQGLDADSKQIAVTCKALKKFYEYNDGERYNISIDYQDMIEMPVRNQEIKLPIFDFLFIDEAQDLSRLDHLFVKRLMKIGTGRRIVVGDPKQGIYGFRGSDAKSFEVFASEPNTITLPLPVCYRSTKAIVRNAKKTYSDIEEWEGAEEGIEPKKAKLSDVQEGDMVLCRNTRPLIHAFLELIRQNKKAYVVGKDMEKGLLSLLAPYGSNELTIDVKHKLEEHLVEMGERLKKEGFRVYQNHPKYISLEEKLQILYLLFDTFSNVYEVEEFIELIFEDDDRDGVRLMTIHRSKGLENDRVFVIENFEGKALIPSTYAVTSDQLAQEKNLKFVSETRAKKELYFLSLSGELKD